MKLLILTLFVAPALLFSLAFAAETADPPKAQPEPPSIYLTPVPADLAKKIADAMDEVAMLHPLSKENAKKLKTRVEDDKPRKYSEYEAYRAYVWSLGFGSIPVLGELMTSEQETVRLNALQALAFLVKSAETVRDEKITETYPKCESLMILLCRRAYLNKSYKVRHEAVNRLGAIGFEAMRRLGGGIELPAGVKDGLMQARQDGVPAIVLIADLHSSRLGLIPEIDDEESMRRWEEVKRWEKEHGMEHPFGTPY